MTDSDYTMSVLDATLKRLNHESECLEAELADISKQGKTVAERLAIVQDCADQIAKAIEHRTYELISATRPDEPYAEA